MGMPYSEMFADSAARRARVLEEVAEEFRQIRLHQFRALAKLSEVRDEPNKILARELVEALRIDPHEAHALLRAATAITETMTPTGHATPAPLPTVRQAASEGAIGVEHTDEITKVMAELPTRVSVEERESVEAVLTHEARLHPPISVKRQGQKLLARLEQDGTDPGDGKDQAEPENTMTYRRSRTGRVRIVAELDAETAEVFEGMILPLAKPKKLNEDTPDPRDKRHRQGDAMSEVIFRAAGQGKSDQAVKTDLIVTLDLTMLTNRVAGATLDGGAFLPPSAVRRLACDAGVIPVVCNGDSVPLDLGRAQRLVPDRLRSALVARDRCCAFPGCDQPARMTEAHHVTHWSEGGPTDLANLVLLCHKHHRVIHGSEWTIVMIHSLPHFIPPKWVDRTQAPMRNVLRF
jgi:plasmid stabilization system protein ParE